MPLSSTKSTLSIESLQAEIVALKSTLAKKEDELNWFKEQYKLMRARRFGKKTEATDHIQHSLFDEHESDEVTETVEPIDNEREQVTYERKKPRHKNGRNIDTSQLPRERQVHDLSDDEKICGCGHALVCIGEDIKEQIDVIPESIKVIEHVTLKYTCHPCDTVKAIKRADHPIAKCMASVNLITDVIIKKYEHHLPLYRQSKIYQQKKIDIPDNTLGNWVMGAADALSPLADAAWAQINHVQQLQVDETPVKILKPDKKGFMWCYHSLDTDNRFVWFEFNLSRAACVVERRLQAYQGLLQSDGYSGYNGLRRQPGITMLGCWDHARRKFAEAVKVAHPKKTGVAGELLAQINKLYKIERHIKSLTLEQRATIRQEQAVPILNTIKQRYQNANALPKSLLGKAIAYLDNQWTYLTEYIQHPQMPISNILIENQIRPFALGKKNWLFMGNERSANQSALLYSLIQSCKINHIQPRHYFNYVLTKTHDMRKGNINPKSLLPQFIDNNLL